MKTKLLEGLVFLFPVLVMAWGGGCTRPMSPLTPVLPSNLPPLTSTPTGTSPTPTTTVLPGWDITNPASLPASLSSGTYNYQYIHIHSGSGLMFVGPVTLNVVQYFALDSGATLTDYNFDAGIGRPPTGSYGGGGHGGMGGSDSLGNPGGPVNDNPLNPVNEGGSGGAGTSNIGGNGGGILRINALSGSVTFNGDAAVNGGNGGAYSIGTPAVFYGMGGGSGGTLFIQANDIEGNGVLTANGGSAASSGSYAVQGGGGGGGIILLSYHTTNNFTGTYSVAGGTAGSPAQPGQPGAFNITTY